MKKYEQFFDINNAFSLSTARSPWVALPMVAFSEFCFYIYASSDISFCDLILDLWDLQNECTSGISVTDFEHSKQ